MDFKKNDIVELLSGRRAEIQGVLGRGGQGIVYDCIVDNEHYALKWYHRDYLRRIDQRRFYENLCDNQETGSPEGGFLWMLDVSKYSRDSFGYLMEIRPKGYSSFTSILNAENRIKSVKVQLSAAKNICRAFQALHRKGYSYQDINDGNFFIDVNTGEVLVCDNDNISPCGTWMGMAGKDRYMAPEVVLGKKHPGMESDLFSLAVILYMLFFISHPLEGRNVHACPCLTTKFVRRFYAEKPLFVYDPSDDSNRPVYGIDNNIINLWPLYPQNLKDMFIRSFTDGLHDASYRVRENEWIECFEKLSDKIVICPKCGGEQFYERSNDGKQTFICEDCGQEIRKPFVWMDKETEKNLYPGIELMDNLILEAAVGSYSGKAVAAKVIESTKHPGLWGIKNLTDEIWNAELCNGKIIKTGKQEIMPLFSNSKVTIGNKIIEIAV